MFCTICGAKLASDDRFCTRCGSHIDPAVPVDETPSAPGAPQEVMGRPEKSFGEIAKFWGRWIAVLPAAVLSVLIVSFPIHWAVLLITRGSNDDESFGISDLPPETLERLGVAFFGPMAYVVAGAKVAPTYKLQTAVVLVVLLAIVLSCSATYVATSDRFDYEGWGWIEFVAVVGLWFGGVIAGGYYVYENMMDEGS